VGWSSNLVAAPLLLGAVVFTALGVGTLLSALTVAYRDFTHLTPFLVQAWMYLTPIIFPVSIVPERWQWLLYLNPLTGVVEGFRAAFLDKPFDFTGLLISILIGLTMMVVGVAYFEKVERRFADII
jgi:lipopolysaccharide transport system permease protein